MNINVIKFSISDRSILSIFRGYQFHRVDTRHVLRDRISFCGRVSSPRCILAIWARSTREKFIYLRFRCWPRERFIHDLSTGSIASMAGPRRPSSLRNKGTSRSHVRNVSSLSRRIERLAFHFRFSFACPSHRASWHGVLQDIFYFDPVKGGVDVFCANVRYTGTTSSSPR